MATTAYNNDYTRAAAENADKLVSLGIKGFWNFTQYDLVHRYENIAVENSIPFQRTVGYQTNRGTENAEIQTLLDGIITTHICII